MKIITLAVATSVDTASPPRGFAELRQPVEGSLLVSDDEAERLRHANLLVGKPEDVPDEGKDAGDGLDDQTVADLHILVTNEGVPLNDATRKADIITAIRKHRADKAA